MNRILFYVGFITLLCLGLQSCNQPVNPKIIGSASLQYDDHSFVYFVEVEGVRYFVDNIIENKEYTDGAPKHLGMIITVFSLPNTNEIRFIAGQRSVSEIEAAFTQNIGALWMCIGFFIVFIIFIFALPRYSEATPSTRTPV